MKTLTIVKIGALLGAATMFTGCATPALWAKRTCRPAEPPHLALALRSDGKDVLVCYDERCGKSSKVRRRAYWLFDNRTKDEYAKPSFTNPAAFDGLNPISVLGLVETNTAPTRGYCAFANPGSSTFHLWRDAQDIGFFSLPSYEGAPPATFWRIGLTPVTVATDAAIVGVFCMGQGAH